MKPVQTGPLEDALFDTVLVANRGEIACRILRTLRMLGIRSVAVYSDDDADARHVREADEAVRLGAASPRQSYLSVPALLAACRQTGAQAVHPGYGFLSENAGFARALADEGIVFIGPGIQALELMGDKIRAKNHVRSHGVPVIPGTSEPGLTDAQLEEEAAAVGFPLLIKPSAGGGGKGMQAVEAMEDLPSALRSARRIAASAFGDDTLLLEHLVSAPRHIEVQVLADAHGNVIHLGERECSLQRRHQKVIEEAPSVLLDGPTRQRIGQAACGAARSVDYRGAGTVEFLVSGANPSEFFFMEMNTRLQVEHPVTEMVGGIDLVEEQIRIAAGQKLSRRQEEVTLDGHAVEARIYAEDPARGFLPASGTVQYLKEPSGPGVRVDSALYAGLVVSPAYDPLLAKVIAWGPDRATALRRLDRALAGTVVLGLATNTGYLGTLLNDDDVRAGRLDTSLIERRLPGLAFPGPGEADLAVAALMRIGALREGALQAGTAAAGGGTGGPWRQADGWRIGGCQGTVLSFAAPDALPATGAVPGDGAAPDPVRVTVTGPPGRQAVQVGNGPSRTAALAVEGTCAVLLLDGVRQVRTVVVHGSDYWVAGGCFAGRIQALSRTELMRGALAARAQTERPADPVLRSPMPGTVAAVAVENGAVVAAGQPVLSVEAMKMEHQISAPVDGVVSLALRPGDQVKAGQVLATIAPAEERQAEERQAGDTGPQNNAITEGAADARL